MRSPSTRRILHTRALLAAACALAGLAAPLSGLAQVYKCTDSAGRVSYQQAPCPRGSTGGRMQIAQDSGASPGTPEDAAVWQSAVKEGVVVPGMPRRYVQDILGVAREMRPGRPGENAAEVWTYPRDNGALRIGFAKGVVAWQRTDAEGGDVTPADRERVAARAAIAEGGNCSQMLQDAGPADFEETVAAGPGEAARRYTYQPVPAEPRTRTVVLCVNGNVRTVDRYSW
jgi:hypothetical protein